ncbi:MAG: hypothetical protein J6A22_00100 [Bacteroidales bacterium]|nr:hypothetical protein [Bacteroidales bacterium]
MKLTKLMLSAFVAALAMISCNKQDTTPESAPSGNPKSVEIDINNLFMTKSPGALLDEGQIQLNELRIYLTDGKDILNTASNAAGELLSASDYIFKSVSGPVSFHFVDPKVNKVVVLANLTEAQYATITDYASIQALSVNIAEQQNEKALALFDEQPLVAAGQQHVPSASVSHDGLITDLYKAELKLKPAISRFELDGFSVFFYKDGEEKSKYNKITFHQVAFNNYYPAMALMPGTFSGSLVDCGAETPVNAVTYLTGNASAAPAWYFDKFATPVEVTRPASLSENTWVEAEIGNAIYYHAFSTPLGGTVAAENAGYPEFMFQIATEDRSGVTSSTYIYTKSLKDKNGNVITSFEPGVIYRMNFTTTVETDGGEGDVPIKEDDIEQLGRCLDITVSVEDWNIVAVTPEF